MQAINQLGMPNRHYQTLTHWSTKYRPGINRYGEDQFGLDRPYYYYPGSTVTQLEVAGDGDMKQE